MKAWKRKVITVLTVLVLCGVTGVICYWVGNNNGYVEGWMEGKVTEALYTQFMDDLVAGEHLEDADIENEIVTSYVLYTHNEMPTAKQAKHLFDLLFDYVFWKVETRNLDLPD